MRRVKYTLTVCDQDNLYDPYRCSSDTDKLCTGIKTDFKKRSAILSGTVKRIGKVVIRKGFRLLFVKIIPTQPCRAFTNKVERITGLEPAPSAWEADALPDELNPPH